MEQMYHAASNLIRDNSKLVGKDIPENFKWKKSIFWGNEKSISTELILEMFGKKGVI